MKIKLSKTKWEEMGKKAGWSKQAQEVDAIPSSTVTLDMSKSADRKSFGRELVDLCKRFNVEIITKTIDI